MEQFLHWGHRGFGHRGFGHGGFRHGGWGRGGFHGSADRGISTLMSRQAWMRVTTATAIPDRRLLRQHPRSRSRFQGFPGLPLPGLGEMEAEH